MEFESRHDAASLGPLLAEPIDDAARPDNKLASVADLVAFVIRRDGLPERIAAAAVLAKLAARLPPLYLTRAGLWADRVADDKTWREDVPPQKKGVQFVDHKPVGFSATSWGTVPAPPRFHTVPVAAKPGVPGLHGVAGAIEVLRLAWCDGDAWALRRHGLDLPRLAVPFDVAAGLFGFGQAVEASKREAVILSAAPVRPPVGKPVAGLPDPAELWREHGELRRAGNASPTKTLAEKYGCSSDTIQREKKKGRPPVASVFAIAR